MPHLNQLKGGKIAKKEFEPLFVRHMQIGYQAATTLQTLSSHMESSALHTTEIIRLEHDADQCAAETHELMDKRFIPRYDKPDIAELVACLDDIADGVHDVAILFRDYDIKTVQQEAVALIALIPKMSAILIKTLERMPKLKLADAIFALEEIKKLERTADTIRSDGRARARKEFSALDFIIWNEIYHKLEQTTDHCFHAMNTIVSIVRKETH